MRYTIRFRIRPDDLRAIHERVGPDGIKSAVRDRSRQVLIDTFVEPDLDYLDTFAERRTALQARAGTALEAALRGDGFDVTLFSLRDVDLGEVGEMLQDAVRRQAELEREGRPPPSAGLASAATPTPTPRSSPASPTRFSGIARSSWAARRSRSGTGTARCPAASAPSPHPRRQEPGDDGGDSAAAEP